MTDHAKGEPGDPAHIVVVGASLVGLSTALALAREGAKVTVLERTTPSVLDVGGGLGVDVELVQQVTGVTSSPAVCHGVDRDTTAWLTLRDWLEQAARDVASIEVHHGVDVTDLVSGFDVASVASRDDRVWRGDLVIGADGVHSGIRRFVDPEHPSATYAGFVLWRAMVPEELLADKAKLPGSREPSREYYVDRYRLVTYPVPGADGDVRVGHRRLNLVWYDPSREALLRAHGLLEGGVVRGSLSSTDVPDELNDELRRIARQTWPPPWAEALNVALERHFIFGTPVAEYTPNRLVSERVALAGDAAHAASPMVGGGFTEGLYDAAQLAESLSSTTSVRDMLASYEEARLAAAREHVAISQRASRWYLDRHSAT